jgi:hypothetical protein
MTSNTPGFMAYVGQNGAADDLSDLEAAVTSFNTTYGVNPSLVVFSGLVCLSATWSPPPGTNLAGFDYQLNRFSQLGGPTFSPSGTYIAPWTSDQTGPLIQIGMYGAG